MTLTPKNWKEFQHYKDRAPAWIKLHRGLLDDFTFHRLPLASRALAPLLWLLASEYEGGAIAASNDEIAFRLRLSVDDLIGAIKPLIDAGFFVASGPLAERKQAACLEKEDIGKIEKEADLRSIEADRPASAPVQIDLEEAIAAKAASPPSRFDDFWHAYPRREGPNPRQPAEKKFNALVKSGLDPEMLIAEAGKLAAAETTRGNIGTRFIPQAATWLNQQRWSDHAAIAFIAEAAGIELHIEAAVKMFAKTRYWSKHAGPEPGQSGCKASPELLAKHGLDERGDKVSAVA